MNPYSWLLPVQASSFAAKIDTGMWVIHILMFIIFFGWLIYFVYLLVAYREREGHKAQRVHISHKASLAPDIIVFASELLIVFAIALPIWSQVKMTMPDENKSTRVEIVGEQFNWNVRYPGPDGKFGKTNSAFVDFSNPFGIDPSDEAGHDDIVVVNDMHFPVGKPVLARLTSKDVIHSFFIPSFRIKQDATPGLVVPVWFEPTLEGNYEVTCAQLCGVGHAIMRADVKVESQAEFDKWLASLAPKKAEAAGEDW